MNKNKELKKLKMKYFWEQKFLEVSKFFGIIILIVGGGGFLPYWLGKFVYYLFPSFIESLWEIELIDMWYCWISGLFSLAILFCIGLLLLIIYCQISDWVESNLEKAEKRARSELKMKMKVANKLSNRGRK